MREHKATAGDIKATHRAYVRKRMAYSGVLFIALVWVLALSWMLLSLR